MVLAAEDFRPFCLSLQRVTMCSMTAAGGRHPGFDDCAMAFLGSEFAGARYVDWPIERRLEAYLRHTGQTRMATGETFDQLLERVMMNFTRARREGRLAPTRK